MWPDEQLKFIPQALCASVMRLAAKDAEPLSHSDNFWVSKVRAFEIFDVSIKQPLHSRTPRQA
jgi:hypothetical protein